MLFAEACASHSCALTERCEISTGNCISAEAQLEIRGYAGRLPGSWSDASTTRHETLDGNVDAQSADVLLDHEPTTVGDGSVDGGMTGSDSSDIPGTETQDSTLDIVTVDASDEPMYDSGVSDVGDDRSHGGDVTDASDGSPLDAVASDATDSAVIDAGEDRSPAEDLAPVIDSSVMDSAARDASDSTVTGMGVAPDTTTDVRGDTPDAMCTGGTTSCTAGCVNTLTDPLHCGACDRACAMGETCTLGVCTGGTPRPIAPISAG